ISDHVTSPSFVLISEFKGRMDLCHIDFYRMEDESQIEELGIEDYLSKENTVCVIEWAEKMGGLLPENSIKIKIESISESKRKFFIEGLDVK
ncbi:tRNA (adenosine(37)-N6)-threonylcarbamoyltransferase complex ATPase subunit type 1 TsaE, partial [Candidatus Margulisiibacteriota bacterium]